MLNILAPRYCAGCKIPKESFCGHCADESFRFGASCIFCNQRNGSGKTCTFCKKIYKPNFLQTLWAGEYKNGLKNAIWELKYKKRKELSAPFGKLIFKKFAEFYPKYKKVDFVIAPIPMHPKKKQERGYNQAELLAEEFGKLSEIGVNSDFLFKIQDTQTQVETKNKESRIKNLENAFSVNQKVLTAYGLGHKAIILVDDVATTGATFLHASQALKKIFPEIKIICLAVAHGR